MLIRFWQGLRAWTFKRLVYSAAPFLSVSDVSLAASLLWVIKNVTFGLGACHHGSTLGSITYRAVPEGASGTPAPAWAVRDSVWPTRRPDGASALALGCRPRQATESERCRCWEWCLQECPGPSPGLGGAEVKVSDRQEAPFSPVLMRPHHGGKLLRSTEPRWGWCRHGHGHTAPSSHPAAVDHSCAS